MLTDAEISIAIADLDPEHEGFTTWHGYAKIRQCEIAKIARVFAVGPDSSECVYRETRQLIEELIKQETEVARSSRRREWALWIAAGAVVAAVVWGLQ